MDLVTEQEKKYGHRLSTQSNFYQRHLIVKHFLSSQKKRLPGQTRRDLALLVASTFNKGQTTARNIVRWEKSWANDNEIPRCKEAKNYESWMSNKRCYNGSSRFRKKAGR